MAEIPLVRPEDELGLHEQIGVPANRDNESQGIQGRIGYIIDVIGDKLVIEVGQETHMVERRQLDGGRRFSPPPAKPDEPKPK